MGSLLVEAAIIGVQTGAVYAIVALGLSLIFGIVRVINFAHGTMLVLSLYIGYYLWLQFGIDPYLSMIIAAPVMFAFGYVTQYVLVRPLFLRERTYVVEPLSVLMLMAGVDMILTNVGILVFDPYVKSVSTALSEVTFGFFGMTFNLTRILIIPIAIVLVFGLDWFLKRTELGNVIQAVGQNREAAAICGINVHHTYAVAFGIGLAVAALGGAALLPFTPIQPTIGVALGIKAFIVVVLGGLGSVRGMLFAGIIIGLIESLSGAFMPLAYSNVIALGLFIVIIVVKPSGLMGTIKV